ncbi:MAG: 4Fe-4S ferredoxin [Planctomycetes bacterium]|nr:4Fe-4S ferredoxin [Planctomycetota bacterium]MDP6409310.1 polysulfide reductase NrfD [Planctomycetota bacterium]
MQFGFVIDHSRCIGCHACTVACKSENDVPLGSFRTWVKYTERGEFPTLKRSFAVLRCNQCSEPPCVTICPVGSLAKRPDGIVDIDPETCIGCKSCMHGCPYDALHIHPDKGIAQKCHFCAHRVEIGLAPACAVVCPTEAIVPGDFHDPQSLVAEIAEGFELAARKPEAQTGPNVRYREAAPAGLDPNLTVASGGYLWAEGPTPPRLAAGNFEARVALEAAEARARTTYDVPRSVAWGGKITGYLYAKSLAAGLFPAAALAGGPVPGPVPIALALVFLALTGLLLVADLKRPERFWRILVRPNWDSWLARGSFIIMAYGVMLTGWLTTHFMGWEVGGATGSAALLATCVAAAATAAYTGWLFGQARGRVLWMKRGLWLHLLAQAAVAGSALLLVARPLLDQDIAATERLEGLLSLGLIVHLFALAVEGRLAPPGRQREYVRAARLITHGPYARQHWLGSVTLGFAVPVTLITLGLPLPAAACALVGLWISEQVFIRAGQALAIS